MIGYGRVSEVKMGRGSLHLHILRPFQKNVPQHKIVKTISENLEKSLCVSDKGENKFCMPVIFRHSMKNRHGLRNTSRIHCL